MAKAQDIFILLSGCILLVLVVFLIISGGVMKSPISISRPHQISQPNVGLAGGIEHGGYTPELLDELGIAHTGGIVTSIGEIEEKALTIAISQVLANTDVSKVPQGKTAVILEDDLLSQLGAKIALEYIGVKVVGTFVSCNFFVESPVYADIYILDHNMVGDMTSVECAVAIYEINPKAVVILNSANSPRSPYYYDGVWDSLLSHIQKAGFKASKVGAVQDKHLFMKEAIEVLIHILSGG